MSAAASFWDPGSATTSLNPEAALVSTREALSRKSAVTINRDRPWRDYLDGLSRPRGGISFTHVSKVKQLWDTLGDRLGQRLPLPLTKPTSSGAIQLAWDAGRYYVEIDVLPAGELEWFFRDRESKEVDGTDEDPVVGLPPELVERLKHVLPR
jgi:hypothetical protein